MAEGDGKGVGIIGDPGENRRGGGKVGWRGGEEREEKMGASLLLKAMQ